MAVGSIPFSSEETLPINTHGMYLPQQLTLKAMIIITAPKGIIEDVQSRTIHENLVYLLKNEQNKVTKCFATSLVVL